MKLLWKLFWTFFKIGAFTFGGGLAMIPIIEKEIVYKFKWIDSKEMIDIIAIAESTPGVIALNSATYVGAKIKGFWGALVASIAVVLPSFVVILAISPFITMLRDIPLISYALFGIRSAVIVLILNAVIKLYLSVDKGVFTYIIIIYTVVFSVLSFFNIFRVDIIIILAISGLLGIIRGSFKRRRHNGIS